MAGAQHRIRRLTLVAEAASGRPSAQAAADTLRRRLPQRLPERLTAALDRVLSKHFGTGRHLVIDRIDCGPIALEEGATDTQIAQLAEAIGARVTAACARQSGLAGRERARVAHFESEADYAAAFAIAMQDPQERRHWAWDSLRAVAKPGVLATALAAAQNRALPAAQVFVALERRKALIPAVDAAKPEAIEAALHALRRPSATEPAAVVSGQVADRSDDAEAEHSWQPAGTNALVAAVAEAARALGATMPLDEAGAARAIMAEPVNWRSPKALAEAVARGLRAHLTTTTAAGRYPPSANLERALEQALATALPWLDAAHLLRRLAREAPDAPAAQEGEGEGEGVPGGSDLVIDALADSLERLAARLKQEPPAKPLTREALALLWQVSVGRDHPRLADIPTACDWIHRFCGLAGSPSLPVEASKPKRHRIATVVSTLLATSQQTIDPPVGPRAARARQALPSGTVKRDASSRMQALGTEALAISGAPGATTDRADPSAVVIEETQAAGLFLLSRALIDLRLRAALTVALAEERTLEAPEITLRRTLWTLALAWSALAAGEAAGDPGIRRFAGLSPQDPAPDPMDGAQCAAVASALPRLPGPGGAAAASGTDLSATILAAWGFWLRGFERSSPDFLLERFVRRPGRLVLRRDLLQVDLAPRPLDLVLRRAGYLDALERPDWLGGGRLAFSIGDGS
ncbi:MAG: hypothetical protein AAF675_18810 [Pseudomonadota bacterium]